MKFFRNFAYRKVSMAQWLEHRSAESEGLSFDSTGTQTFFFVPRSWQDPKKNTFLDTEKIF